MYYEAQVVFVEEIPTKNGVREKKTRRAFLVECDSVSVAEAKVNEVLVTVGLVHDFRQVEETIASSIL